MKIILFPIHISIFMVICKACQATLNILSSASLFFTLILLLANTYYILILHKIAISSQQYNSRLVYPQLSIWSLRRYAGTPSASIKRQIWHACWQNFRNLEKEQPSHKEFALKEAILYSQRGKSGKCFTNQQESSKIFLSVYRMYL